MALRLGSCSAGEDFLGAFLATFLVTFLAATFLVAFLAIFLAVLVAAFLVVAVVFFVAIIEYIFLVSELAHRARDLLVTAEEVPNLIIVNYLWVNTLSANVFLGVY